VTSLISATAETATTTSTEALSTYTVPIKDTKTNCKYEGQYRL